MLPIRKFTTSFDGKLRLEFIYEGRLCAATVEPTHVILQDDGQMAIAIKQELGGQRVVVWHQDGTVDAGVRLKRTSARPQRRQARGGSAPAVCTCGSEPSDWVGSFDADSDD
jgi:hypothetical protein